MIHDDKLLEDVGFILLPLPILIAWALELFEIEEEEDHEQPEESKPEPKVREAIFSQDARTRSKDRLVAIGARSSAELKVNTSKESAPAPVVANSRAKRSESLKSAKGKYREAEATRLEEEVNDSSPDLWTWLKRLAGVPLVAICVYLVIAHFASG